MVTRRVAAGSTALPPPDPLVVEELAAFRNLAALAAKTLPLQDSLAGIAREMTQVLGAGHAVVARYEADGFITIVSGWNHEHAVPRGSRWRLEGRTVSEAVYRTRAPGRIDCLGGTGELSTKLRKHGVVSSAGYPLIVGRKLWGVAIAASNTAEWFLDDTTERMRGFADVAVAVIASQETHMELTAARARIVAATDQARYLLERDLEGTQQRLVSILLEIQGLTATPLDGPSDFQGRLVNSARDVQAVMDDLLEIARRVYPATLVGRRIEPALATLVRRSPVPVELSVSAGRRLPEAHVLTVIFLVSAALTHAAEHTHATAVRVDLVSDDTSIRLSISDDGVGGADVAGRSELLDLADRVEALGGTLRILGPPGRGTSLIAEIPTGPTNGGAAWSRTHKDPR
ncbi:GAF domain-containing sensor histidine kinase [Actinoallomurus bryophytorum]|nr:GAF domain-containing protein [Actinoallomurus bryophytorum]